ncbi:hypothetical protein F5X68DRAFT_72169 [Plectosphaerella plurivora]|uniref:Uncharacterized protein n=1 Tax=Plectosphaerella plurivora TaxID=936078 RepID=A0A9P9ACL6_9PEZI|nr:hypothetical protein F5X68DRAFT_72169 [Plectosphaerella plurivora]
MGSTAGTAEPHGPSAPDREAKPSSPRLSPPRRRNVMTRESSRKGRANQSWRENGRPSNVSSYSLLLLCLSVPPPRPLGLRLRMPMRRTISRFSRAFGLRGRHPGPHSRSLSASCQRPLGVVSPRSSAPTREPFIQGSAASKRNPAAGRTSVRGPRRSNGHFRASRYLRNASPLPGESHVAL